MSNLITSRSFFPGIFILLVLTFSANSQEPARTPTPADTPSQQTNQQREEYLRQKEREREQRELNVRRRNLMMISNPSRPVTEKLRKDIETLYRKTSKKELNILAVNKGDAKTYERFLKQNKSGLTKLIEDLGCSENQNVVVATEDCLKYSMPGGGSSYSFRVNDYRIPRLADITFTDSTFHVTGKLLHGVLTGIGDVPLEKINLQSPGIKYLIDFQPVRYVEDAVLTDKQLSAGLTKDGFFYSRRLKAVDNMTYLLRSIAYDGELYRAVNGVTYNELDFDRRRDVIIAFRIVSRESDKSITILWKELENKDSSKMKRKTEDRKSVKENNFVAREGKL